MNAESFSETELDRERARLIKNVTKDAAKFLGLSLSKNTPNEIVASVNDTITRIVLGKRVPIPKKEERHLLLGCLWGAQLIRELNWEWCEIHFGDGLDVAVASPARDIIVFPFTFVAACLGKQVVCTVELSFNMLVERAPEYDTGTYLNLMDHVHHIVPPYTLEREAGS